MTATQGLQGGRSVRSPAGLDRDDWLLQCHCKGHVPCQRSPQRLPGLASAALQHTQPFGNCLPAILGWRQSAHVVAAAFELLPQDAPLSRISHRNAKRYRLPFSAALLFM